MHIFNNNVLYVIMHLLNIIDNVLIIEKLFQKKTHTVLNPAAIQSHILPHVYLHEIVYHGITAVGRDN